MQTLSAISERILKMRQDTAPQLVTRLHSYTIRWDTGPRAVYIYLSTEPVSRRLAAPAGKPDWHIRFSPSASAKAKRRAAEKQRAGRVRTRMLTPLIDGLGRATWSSTMPVTRSRTPSFYQNRLFSFLALVALELLVSL